jgi:lysophospholipase L1-like esterase
MPTVVVYAAVVSIVVAAVSASHFTWLPLGDSITWGCGNGVLPHEPNDGCEADAASYRIPTCQGLEQANITITTVGNRTAAPASAPAKWAAHEGLPGYRIDQLNALAPSWTQYNPQVVSMLLGANDCLQGDGGATALDRMTTLLNTTATALPFAKVFVGSILDVPGPSAAKDCQVTFNAALPALVQQADGGRGNFVYVPIAENTTGVCGNDKTTWSIGDGVHPNAAGHARVASVMILWMRRILCPNFEVDRAC